MNRKSRAWIAGTGGLACFLLLMFLLGWHIGVRDSGGHLTTGVHGALQALGITTLTLLGFALFLAATWGVADWIDKGEKK